MPVTINQGFRDARLVRHPHRRHRCRAGRKGYSRVGRTGQRNDRRPDRTGIESERIVLAGFSQGGAIALHAGLRYYRKLAGIMAMSTYLPLADSLAKRKIGRQCRYADFSRARLDRPGDAGGAGAEFTEAARAAGLHGRMARVPRHAAQRVAAGDISRRRVAGKSPVLTPPACHPKCAWR